MSDELPAPDGVGGHLRYSWSALRRLRRLSRELDALDEALRATVRTRDDRLARVGEAALAETTGIRDGRLAAFAETVEEQAEAHRVAEERRADAEAALAEIERVRRERLEDAEAAVETARAGRDTAKAADAELAQRAADLERSLDRADEDEDPTEAQAALAAMRTPREQAAARAAEAETLLQEAKVARAAIQREQDAAVDAARQEVEDARREAERAANRRQATLVDLGREALQGSAGGSDARASAEESLSEMEVLRARHRSTIRARDAIDTAPIARTLLTLVGGLLLAGLLALVF